MELRMIDLDGKFTRKINSLGDAGCSPGHLHVANISSYGDKRKRVEVTISFILHSSIFFSLHNKLYLRRNTQQHLRLQISIREQSHLPKKQSKKQCRRSSPLVARLTEDRRLELRDLGVEVRARLRGPPKAALGRQKQNFQDQILSLSVSGEDGAPRSSIFLETPSRLGNSKACIF